MTSNMTSTCQLFLCEKMASSLAERLLLSVLSSAVPLADPLMIQISLTTDVTSTEERTVIFSVSLNTSVMQPR